MRNTIFAVLMLFCLNAKALTDDAQISDTSQITQFYDKAFGFYIAGDYQKAIDHWGQILRIDPSQVTAKNMIEEARQKLSKSADSQRGRFYALVARGKYREALIKMEEMLGLDPTNPVYAKLRDRLKKVSAITESKPLTNKAWDIASQGIYHYANEDEDLPFAYDAFRYSAELLPQDTRLPKLVAMLEDDSPQLKLNDTKPPESKILEHKKEMALQYIYDSKFYLARKELESVLKLEPEDVTALKRLGSTYLQLKDYNRARAAWEKALKAAPEDTQLKEYLQALNKVSKAPPPAKGKKAGETKKRRPAKPAAKS